jgi:putative redox protein
VGLAEVQCSYEQPSGGEPTQFDLILRLPGSLDDSQRERLRQIAAKCPVHRVLAGGVSFKDRVELLQAQSTT